MNQLSEFAMSIFEVGQGEARARWGELSEDEKRNIGFYLREVADAEGFIASLGGLHLEDWERIIPGLADYL